jgi:hypothetical protein
MTHRMSNGPMYNLIEFVIIKYPEQPKYLTYQAVRDVGFTLWGRADAMIRVLPVHIIRTAYVLSFNQLAKS